MFNIKKFFAGFNIFDGEKAGKILFYVILISACLTVYHMITRPQQVQKIVVQKGGTANIQQKTENKKSHWAIGANVQSDKTIGVSLMYLF